MIQSYIKSKRTIIINLHGLYDIENRIKGIIFDQSGGSKYGLKQEVTSNWDDCDKFYPYNSLSPKILSYLPYTSIVIITVC